MANDTSRLTLSKLRLAYSNRSVTIYPYGTKFDETYPSIGVTLPTGSGPDVDIYAETLQIHAGSKFWMPGRAVTIFARRLLILPAIQGAGGASDRVTFDLSGTDGASYTTPASNGGHGSDGWASRDNHVLWWNYNCGSTTSGGTGGWGGTGNPGTAGGTFYLQAEISCPKGISLEVLCKGGNGGQGQTGGNGGDGGNGAHPGDMPDNVSDAGCQSAINAGNGGDGGYGGRGGPAGKGGRICIVSTGSPGPIGIKDWTGKKNDDGTTSLPKVWEDKIEEISDVNILVNFDEGKQGEGGICGVPGKKGNAGRWEHQVFINTTRGQDGQQGSDGRAPGNFGLGTKADKGDYTKVEGKVGDSYEKQYTQTEGNFIFWDPIWLTTVARRLMFEFQVIFGMTGIDFSDNDTIAKRIGEIPQTIKWLSAFYEAYQDSMKDVVRANDSGDRYGLWFTGRQAFIDTMNQLLDMQSHDAIQATDMFGHPYNYIPVPNINMDDLSSAVKDLEQISSQQYDWHSIVAKDQIEQEAANKAVESARNTVDTFKTKSEDALKATRSQVVNLQNALKSLNAAKDDTMDQLKKMFDAGAPAAFGKDKMLKIAESLATVLMFTEPELAVSAKAVGSVLSMATAGITTPELMSTPSGDIDPQFVRNEIRQVGAGLKDDAEKLGDAIIDAATANGVMKTTIAVDKTQFNSLCNKYFPDSSSAHAKQVFNRYIQVGQVFNKQVAEYNEAVKLQLKLSLDYLNAKRVIDQVSISSEKIDSSASLMSGLLSILQSMQQREVLSIFNSVVKALQALKLESTTMVDTYLGLGSWDKLFLMDAHNKTVASTLSADVSKEIRSFKTTWSSNRPTRSSIKVTLTPATHPWVFNPGLGQKTTDGKPLVSPLRPFNFLLDWEELAKNADPKFGDVFDIRLRDAWVYLTGATNVDTTKSAISVSLRLGGNFDVNSKSGVVHPFQTEATEFPSQYTYATKTADGHTDYQVVPISRAEDQKLLFVGLGKDADYETYPCQGIIRDWEISWDEEAIDVSKVTSIVIDMEVDIRSGGITPKTNPDATTTSTIIANVVSSVKNTFASSHAAGFEDMRIKILPLHPQFLFMPQFVRGAFRMFKFAKDTYEENSVIKAVADNVGQKVLGDTAKQLWEGKPDEKERQKRKKAANFTRIEIKRNLRKPAAPNRQPWTIGGTDKANKALRNLAISTRPASVGALGGYWPGGGNGNPPPPGPGGDDPGHLSQRIDTTHADKLVNPHAAFRAMLQSFSQRTHIINPSHSQQLASLSDPHARQAYIQTNAAQIQAASDLYFSDPTASLEGCMVSFGNNGCVTVEKILSTVENGISVHGMVTTPLEGEEASVFHMVHDTAAPGGVTFGHLDNEPSDAITSESRTNAIIRDALLTTTFDTIPHLLEAQATGKTDLDAFLATKDPVLYDARRRLESFDTFSTSGTEIMNVLDYGGSNVPNTEVHLVSDTNGKSALEVFMATPPDKLAQTTPVITDEPAGLEAAGRQLIAAEGLLGIADLSSSGKAGFKELSVNQVQEVRKKTGYMAQHVFDVTRLAEIQKEVKDYVDKNKSSLIDGKNYKTTAELFADLQRSTDFRAHLDQIVDTKIAKYINKGQLLSQLSASPALANIKQGTIKQAISDVLYSSVRSSFTSEDGLVDSYTRTHLTKLNTAATSDPAYDTAISKFDAAVKNLEQEQNRLIAARGAMLPDDPKRTELESELNDVINTLEEQKKDKTDAEDAKARKADSAKEDTWSKKQDKDIKEKEDAARRRAASH